MASEAGRIKTVFVVEDDDGILRLLERALGTACRLRTFTTGRDALNALQVSPPDLLLTDLEVPEIIGETLAWAAARLAPRPRVVLMSGNERRLTAAAHLANATLLKPFPVAALRELIDGEDPSRLPS